MTNNPSIKRPPLPDGPWTAEPDRVEFEHLGFPCILNRGGMGNWCGYVGVPPGHPWHGVEYGNLDVEVHGGLTYSNACQGEICHVPKPGETDDVFWFGFDCAHSGDMVPGMIRPREAMHELLRAMGEREQYRDQAYVTAETKRLAEQAKACAG